MKKSLKSAIMLAGAMLIAPLASNAQAMPEVIKPSAKVHTISDNGLYAVGSDEAEAADGTTYSNGGIIFNTETRKSIDIKVKNGKAQVYDVSNDGTVVGSMNGKPATWSVETQQWTTYPYPEGYIGGCFIHVTGNGKYAVGYYATTDEFSFAPMAYNLETGEVIDTPNLPVVDLSGLDQHQNAFFGISEDGRYIIGEMSQSYLMPVALFSYVYDTSTSTWTPIGYSYNAATQLYKCTYDNLHFIENQTLSADGKWVTGTAYMIYNGGQSNGGTEGSYPYRYNIADQTLEVYTDSPDMAGNAITPDGTMLASSPAGNPYPTGFIRSGKFFISLDQVFSQVYGRTVEQMIGYPVTGLFSSISADGLTAVLLSYENSCILRMKEPFADAAAKVDLLGNYSLSIPDGSKISMMQSITLTFDRSVNCMVLPRNVELLDSKGTLVRNASGFTVSNASDRSIVVTFRSTALTPGETYTVRIPAGMIWLKDDSSKKTEEIRINYVGRNNEPMKPISIAPASGSLVAQFNSSPDNITIEFDSPVLVQETGKCTLYNADDNTKIADFNGGYSGNKVQFYPVASYMLYRGTNYKVVIDAGTITDLSGQGGNEEIVLNYTGTYVRQLSDDDLCLFKSTCDDYNHFIFWKNNFNTPSSTPIQWGFSKESTWLLLRDNEKASDWAMATHSMFSPAAESDDWLIIPQIFIPDEKCFLQFQAQSYLDYKNDNLKVYVCNDDAVYNYFSKELTDKFRTEGDLVFDEIIPAGATNEGLEGEWTDYTVNLDKYAGQNIYIAFVYNNYDQSAIFLDNIEVRRNMNFAVTNQTPTTLVDADNVAVKGMVTIESPLKEYKGIKIELLNSDNETVSTIEDADITLKKGDVYDFAFAEALPLVAGRVNDYKIKISSDDETLELSYSVKNLLFECNKKVILEEYTGSECGNCPMGIVAIENLEKLYPNNFIPLTLRTYQSDMYGSGAYEYTAFLGLTGAPTGRINRGEILSPMLQNGSKGYTFNGRGIIMDNGEEAYLWADAVQDELNTPAEASISFAPDYNVETGALSVPVEVTFALDSDDTSYGVFAVMSEDQLPCYQSNYMYGTSDPLLGQWGQGGIYAQNVVYTWLANDVVRHVVNGSAFNGEVLNASSITAGEPYTVNLHTTVPKANVYNANNCFVTVMLVNRSTGRIVNAEKHPMIYSGINGIEADTDNAEAVYYNLQGMRVDNPAHGNVYIKVQGGKSSKILF